MIDYDKAQKMFRRHKSALTRAKNSGDPQKVIDAVDKAEKEWEDANLPTPDAWNTWIVARDDARREKARQ